MQFQDQLKKYFEAHPVTSIILILNTLFALLVLLSGGFTINNLVNWGGLVPILVTEQNEYHRLVLAMFLHGGIFHFLMNSYVLYIIGGQLERIIGPVKFSILYVISGLFASIFVVLFGEPNVVTIGASGAIYGVMGGLFMLTLLKKSWFRPQSINWIRQLILINLVLTFIIPNISVWGHLGGLIGGFLLFYFLTPKKPYFVVQYEIKNDIIDAEQNF